MYCSSPFERTQSLTVRKDGRSLRQIGSLHLQPGSRERIAVAQLAFLFFPFHSGQNPAPRAVLPTARVGLSSLVKLLHEHSQTCVSTGFLSAANLTMTMSITVP